MIAFLLSSDSPSTTMLPAGFMRMRKESSASVATQTTQATTSKPNRAKSPTFSTTTAASDMPLSPGVVITRADLRASIKTYEEVGGLLRPSCVSSHRPLSCQLVGALASYRNALTTVSNASAKVARALENCARLKGLSDDAACGLQAAGGLHHVIANHEQVLVSYPRTHVSISSRDHRPVAPQLHFIAHRAASPH